MSAEKEFVRADEVRLNRVQIQLISRPVADIPAEIKTEMDKFRSRVKPGMRIAITAGSRGISNLALIIKCIAHEFTEMGAKPFVIPAMGSHGGATAEGQKNLLAGYGVTEEAMGVPVLSSMEVVEMGVVPENPALKVYMDRYAYEADATFVVNRVKVHTDFHGEHESGLVKMLVIGLGKHQQALATHSHLQDGLRDFIPLVAREIINSGKIIGGLGIAEDGYEQTSILKAAFAEEIMAVDHELLVKSREMLPRLPFKQCDVLVVDQFGKNISGTGIDPNIVGRMGFRNEAIGDPKIGRICLLDVTEQSHGCVTGIGLADVVTRRIFDKINWQTTYENVVTSHFLERGFLPVVQETDRQAIETAIYSTGYHPEGAMRLCRIKDTLHMDTVYVTDSLLPEVAQFSNATVAERNIPLVFNEKDELEKL